MGRQAEEIQAEYNQLCAVAGEKAYQVTRLETDLANIYARVAVINEEMGEIKRAALAEPLIPTDTPPASEVPDASGAV